MRFFILSAFFALFSFVSTGQSTSHKQALDELQRRGEVYFSFDLPSHDILNGLSQIISIDQVKGNRVTAYANAGEFAKFENKNVEYQVLTAPSELFPVQMSSDPKQVLTWNYYPTYDAYVTLMQDFATNHPDICKLLTITQLNSGRKILALRISDNVDVQEDEPEFLYVSSIHGDELTGYINLLHLADYLLSGYGTDPRATDLVNNFDIVLCPLHNPDGTYKGGNNTVWGATRTNANNIDLNRNFPDPQDGQHPDGNAWQPENVAFMNFAGQNSFNMSANFHGGAEVVNYPWDTWSKLAADNNWWIYVSREFADTVHKYAPANYLTDYQNGITNGYAWYEVNGGRQDYMNYFRNCREVTIEISDTKTPPENQLINFWNYDYRSMLGLIEESGYGLRGLVIDSLTGVPLKARVYINGFDKDSSQVFTDPDVGDYHRMLKAGTYNVTFSAAGYYPKTFTVTIADRNSLRLDVQLYNGSLYSNFTADTTQAAVDQSVHFTSSCAGNPDVYDWSFPGGQPEFSNEVNPSVTYSQPGLYNVSLIIFRAGLSDTLIRNGYIEVKPYYLPFNKTYTVCNARFFDDGGPALPYSANLDRLVTFVPQTATAKLLAKLNTFDLQAGGTSCDKDYLEVYDGLDASAPMIGQYCGSSFPTQLLASNASGALTFHFHSDGSTQNEGWDLGLSCINNVSVEESVAHTFRIFPNPLIGNRFIVENIQDGSQATLTDLNGTIQYRGMVENSSILLDGTLCNGLYVLTIYSKSGTYRQKVIVNRP